ncbi:MAG: polysaccharide deacetylase family protein [Burkholderiales bacterium]|nr:polysaccharide deacetylase family protein [Burkholderiales bacterium]
MSRVLVLMYHQVDAPRSAQEQRFCTSPADFAAQMQWLAGAGYRAVDLDAVVGHVKGCAMLPEKSFHISFDDGFVGVLEHALPTLAALRMPATLFALPRRTGLTNDWMHRRGAPRRALLSAPQLQLLADEGFTIGSHSCTHARLPELDADAARQEIVDSKSELEAMLGREVRHFAYPYGLFDERVREIVVQAGYASACSTRSGFNRPGEDPYLLRRIDIAGTDKQWQFRQKLQYGSNEAKRLQPLAYYAGRLRARLGPG